MRPKKVSILRSDTHTDKQRLTSDVVQRRTETGPVDQPALEASPSRLFECENRGEAHESRHWNSSEMYTTGRKEEPYLWVGECALKEFGEKPLNKKELQEATTFPRIA